jgi:hypothetical protein
MVAQFIYGLALGYVNLNDHEELRHDPLLAVAGGTGSVSTSIGFRLANSQLTRSGAVPQTHRSTASVSGLQVFAALSASGD